MLQEDDYYMRMALNEAKLAYEKGEVPVGAVVVCKGLVIGKGHNLTECLRDVTAHAEMQALTAAFSYLRPATSPCTHDTRLESYIQSASR